MKDIAIKLPFGLKANNTIVHISDVESGKDCGLACPSCRSQLIAVKGHIKQHHFRHANIHECAGGLESAIHLAAKQILKEKKQIALHEYEISRSKIDSKGNIHRQQMPAKPSKAVIKFNSVQDEVPLDGIIADILATKDNKQLIIEILYTHKVDDEKREKIIKANMSAIEIKLSDLTPDDLINWDSFWSCINDPERIQWLHHNKSAEYNQKLEFSLNAKVKKQEAAYKYEEIVKQKKEQNEKRQLLQAQEEIKFLSSNHQIEKLKQDARKHPELKKHLKYRQLSWDKLPKFLNINVPNGDWIFGCDKRMWQTLFYSYFVCFRGKPFSLESVDNWLQNTMGLKVPNSVKTCLIYGKKYPELLSTEISDNKPSSWKTLKNYFDYLCELGILIFSEGYHQNQWIVVSEKPITLKQITTF